MHALISRSDSVHCGRQRYSCSSCNMECMCVTMLSEVSPSPVILPEADPYSLLQLQISIYMRGTWGQNTSVTRPYLCMGLSVHVVRTATNTSSMLSSSSSKVSGAGHNGTNTTTSMGTSPGCICSPWSALGVCVS